MKKVCKVCRLNSRIPSLTIDSQGLCDYCSGRKITEWERAFNVTEEVIKKRREELENIFAEIKGKFAYDCVLALSGGKDSAYLLNNLIAERGMKVLAVHVKTCFHSRFPEENIAILKERLNFDLEIIAPERDFYIEFYSKLLKRHGNGGLRDAVCPACGAVYLGHCMRIATDKRIPLVITGFSPAQFVFFEGLREKIKDRNTWIPDVFNAGEYSEEFLSNFWDPSKYPENTAFPRLLVPLHVMEYNIEIISNKLSSINLLPRKRLSIFKTNCRLIWALTYLDLKFIGYNQDSMWFAYLIRKGMVGKRSAGVLHKVINKVVSLINYALYLCWVKILTKKLEKDLNLKFKDILSGANSSASSRENKAIIKQGFYAP